MFARFVDGKFWDGDGGGWFAVVFLLNDMFVCLFWGDFFQKMAQKLAYNPKVEVQYLSKDCLKM